MAIALKPDGITIDGQPVIVLSSSLFYFRLPRGLWLDRMVKIRQAGYNAIDVYFPWNYHELAEGKWNFHGERDIAEFLHMAQDAGLWIIARPGPYICSEWDGGGLPAYLFTKPGLRIRDNDPRYLRYVSRWFDHILAILEPYQIDRGGSIIAVQLENELDFFDCQDRAGYMQALRDMAHDHDIRVPLIACAGQGDLRGGSGNVAGLIPTCNIYNSDFDPGVEQRAYHLHQRLQTHGLPLCVTETNRSHFFLRRLLSAGAKLLGPYLQTGGYNFGFSSAVNNWGQPLAFLTSDYDFGGMIASDGTLREDYREAKLFTRTIAAFGPSLAQAVPLSLPAETIQGGLSAVEGGPYGLDLDGGGRLLAVPNLTNQPQTGTIQLDRLTFPCHSQLTIEPARCPLLPLYLPLARWGMEGGLVYATAEIAAIQPVEKGLAIAFYTDGVGEIALSLPEGVQVSGEGMQQFREDTRCTFTFTTGQSAAGRVHYSDGRELVLYGLSRGEAAHTVITEDGRLTVEKESAPKAGRRAKKEPEKAPIIWHSQNLNHLSATLDFKPAPSGIRAPSLEEMGILRGYGWYRTQVPGLESNLVIGYLLKGGADVLSLYADGRYVGTVTPGGGSAYLPLEPIGPVNQSDPDAAALEVRAEIWGHSNFDDSRLPALRLDSLRGLSGLVAILHARDLSANWHINQLETPENKDLYTAKGFDTQDWPLVSFAGWLSTRGPNQICYRKHITAGTGPVDCWVLQFPGLTRPVEVSVNGSPYVRVTPLDPFFDISANVGLGRQVELTVYAEQDYHAQLSGRVVLLEGKSAQGWSISGKDAAGLWTALNAAVDPAAGTAPVQLPVQVDPGELRLLCADLPEKSQDSVLRCQGRNAKLSVFFNGHLVGRIWLSPGSGFPRMAGGSPDCAYLPEPWWEKHNRLLVLVESIVPNSPAEVGPFEGL